MLGAIAGDFVGSRFEANAIKTTEFDLVHEHCNLTDDSVMTMAIADALLHTDGCPEVEDFREAMVRWGQAHPNAGYGMHFMNWVKEGGHNPYGSAGNGSCMRVSPVAWFGRDLADVARLARISALPSHDHPDGIRGAIAVAVATRMALEGWEADDLEYHLAHLYGYRMDIPTDIIRPNYRFFVMANNSAPPALRCAIEGKTWEEAVRLAVSLGGDADTMAAMAGGVAEGHARARGDRYPVPEEVRMAVMERLAGEGTEILVAFEKRFEGVVFTKSDISALQVIAPYVHDSDD